MRRIPKPEQHLLLAIAVTYLAHLWGFTTPIVSAVYLCCGLIPFYLYLGGAQTAREGAKRGFLFGFLSHLTVCFWMIETLRAFTGWPWIAGTLGGILVWIGICAFSALPMAALGLLHGLSFSYFRDRKWSWLFFLPAAVYVVDCAIPKYFPNTLGQALYALRSIRQIADLGGVWLLTSLLFAVNGCVHLAVFHSSGADAGKHSRFHSHRQRALLVGIAILLVLTAHFYGGARLKDVVAVPTTVLRAGIVQPGFNASIELRNALATPGGRDGVKERILNDMSSASEDLIAHHPDWILWPETSYPDTFLSASPTEHRVLTNALLGKLEYWQVPLWMGARDQIGAYRYNTFYAVSGVRGKISREFYHKRRLVPLSESIPFSESLEAFEVASGIPIYSGLRYLGMSNFKPGAGPKLFNLESPAGAFRFAPHICFEGLFPFDAAIAAQEGAHAFVNLTNDAWFGQAWVSEQALHLYLTAFRSVEVRRPTLRVTSTGMSATIDPTGDVHAFSGFHEAFSGVVEFKVSASPVDSFFGKHPYAVFTICLILCVIAGILILAPQLSAASLQRRRPSKNSR